MRQLRSVVSELLTALTSTLNDERDSARECLSRAAELLQTAGETLAPGKPTNRGLAPWQVRTLTSHVETNLDKPIRSSELATVVRLNPAYFCRVFRESFGEPPLQYISRRHAEGVAPSARRRAHALAAEHACEVGEQGFSRDDGPRKIESWRTPDAWERVMRTKIGGVLETEIYSIDDGFVAIEQARDTVVLLAPDELLMIIKELQAYYDARVLWQEPTPG
jgi:AraC-like DNA-binding protein